MNPHSTGVIVLAAGKGTRMRSALPKVLHGVCGTPMVAHVITAARAIEPARIAVVVGFGAERVRDALTGEPGVVFVEQREQLGTGDAVRHCREAMAGLDTVVVLNGDCPLIPGELVQALVEERGSAPLAFATCDMDDPGKLGRVLRDGDGRVAAIVEAADYTGEDGRAEINAGQYAFDAAWLWANIENIPISPKGEYYLTHLPAVAYEQGLSAVTVAGEPLEVLGVDDRVRLAEAERLMRDRVLRRAMDAGATIVDPATTYIDARVQMSEDVTILPNCYLQGETHIAGDCVIGPGTVLRNAKVGAETRIQQSVIEESSIGERVRVGPFAHVRGGASIGDDCELGNYAEVKNSVLGRGVKMHHFSYVGDADVGEYANIAAGIITCNFDGVNKHRTTIGARAFVGSDSMLVAPVTIGDDAVTGAGSVVTKDIPAGAKAVGMPARVIGRAKRDG